MASPKSRFARKFATYRPVIDRVVFGVAVLGILTSVHLGIQQKRGFDQGCFGFSTSQQVEDSFDCAAVTQSEASNLFGVSNSTWGLLFYLAVASLTALAAFNVRGKLEQFKWARAALIFVGFAYTLYLVYYQFFGIGELCALCLTLAGLTTILFVLQAVDYRKSPESKTQRAPSMTSISSKRELKYMGAVALLALVLIGADFAYFGSLDVAEPSVAENQPAPRVSNAQADSPRTSNAQADSPRVGTGECAYDPQKAPVEDFSQLINFFDPEKGNPNASVTVIEYFDPNCPHCKTLHPIVDKVAESHGDKARFVFKPFVLWNHSITQSEALYAAAQEGKFFDMLDHQYAIQQPQTGLSEDQLRAIAEQIGMNPDVLMQRVRSGLYRRMLAEQKEMAADAGVTGTPAVLINGRFVDGRSRTVECLAQLIDQAAQS